MKRQVGYKTFDYRLIPERAHPTDAGADLRTIESFDLYPGDVHLFDTGVAVAIPEEYVGLVFNRSSQGKVRVVLTNGVGVIDSDYRGNVKVLLANDGENIYKVKAYDTKIAQLVITPIVLADFVQVIGSEEDWLNTKRNTGGFGSTGE